MQWDECGDEDYGIIYAWSRYRLKRTLFFLRPDVLLLIAVSLTALFFARSPDRMLFSIPVVFLLSAVFLTYIATTETSRMTKKGLILHLEPTLIPREKSLEDLLHYFARLSWPALLGYVIVALSVFQYHAYKRIDAPVFVNTLHATTLALGFGVAIAPGSVERLEGQAVGLFPYLQTRAVSRRRSPKIRL